MTGPAVRRHSVVLQPDSSRVVLKSFIPGRPRAAAAVIGRALALSEAEATAELDRVFREFGLRHQGLADRLLQIFRLVETHLFTQRPLTSGRRQLIGALFAGEYALESAALFNPSIVPHPDQSGVEPGGLRFILSLRATGEGHVSSIEFRSGLLSAHAEVSVDEPGPFVSLPTLVPNPTYRKQQFLMKLHEMGFHNPAALAVLGELGDEFSRLELTQSISRVQRREPLPVSEEFRRTLEGLQWLADSNYEVQFTPDQTLAERLLFPATSNESNGMEDARFVRFTDDDGAVLYYATYTAYNGRSILPQLIETEDFLHFRMLTLNGSAVQNKGMALFPRRIGGRYAMLSRQDDENLFLLFSDHPHYWTEAKLLLRPAQVWESVKIGNCGSPIETRAGWLVITHGVGPLRKYCIGAVLLDLEDPSKVVGRLDEPLLSPEEDERVGYVPNVVYSCGSLVHGGRLILPYALSDRAAKVASVDLEELLSALTANPRREP